jgi:hypothetical protein
MQRYINQLIEDLEAIAVKPPEAPWTETLPHLAHDPVIAELALVPFKPISEWTGIGPEVFPDVTELEGGQWERVNEEIYNGFYNDDGEKIDPESEPIPSLCLNCKSYDSGDWEENLLCLMNRFDQKDDEEFRCGAFEQR